MWGVIVSVQDILAVGEQNSVAGVGNSGDSLYCNLESVNHVWIQMLID